MKYLRSIFTLALATVFSLNLMAQNVEENIGNAIKVGNSKALSAHFGPKVDLTIKDTEDNYSKAQAELILKDFFANNSPSDYKVIHRGEKNGAQYFIGSLTTSNGNYRTYLLIRTDKDVKRIQQLRIEASQ